MNEFITTINNTLTATYSAISDTNTIKNTMMLRAPLDC